MMSKGTITSVSAIIILTTALLLASCGGEIAVVEDPTATPTPTQIMQVMPPTQTETPSKCAGFAGELEVQVLVGPAQAVGLEPFTIGNISIGVTGEAAPYLIQGSGRADYSEILTEEWGTYEVTMNLDFMVNGECADDGSTGQLFLAVEMAGSQMVEVTAEGFHGEYPWEGTHTVDLELPIEDGSSIAGEGYIFILHLK
jgi:hypothetical protein